VIMQAGRVFREEKRKRTSGVKPSDIRALSSRRGRRKAENAHTRVTNCAGVMGKKKFQEMAQDRQEETLKLRGKIGKGTEKMPRVIDRCAGEKKIKGKGRSDHSNGGLLRETLGRGCDGIGFGEPGREKRALEKEGVSRRKSGFKRGRSRGFDTLLDVGDGPSREGEVSKDSKERVLTLGGFERGLFKSKIGNQGADRTSREEE